MPDDAPSPNLSVSPASPPAPTPLPTKRRRPRGLWARFKEPQLTYWIEVVLVAIGIGVTIWLTRSQARTDQRPCILVTRIENVQGDPNRTAPPFRVLVHLWQAAIGPCHLSWLLRASARC